MAYVARQKTVSSGGSVTSMVVSLPTHESGDLLLLYVGMDYSSNLFGAAPTDWFTIINVTSGGEPCAVYGHYATTSATPDPTITCSSAVRTLLPTTYVIKEAPTSAAIDVSTSATSNVFRGDTESVTPTSANTLIFNILLGGESKRLYFEPTIETITGVYGASYNYIVGVFNHEPASTATPTHKFANTYSSMNTARVTIAIKDAGSGVMKGQVEPSTTAGNLLTPFTNAELNSYYDDSTKNVDPTSLITTIKGDTANYKTSSGWTSISPWLPIASRGYSINSSGDWNKHLIFQWGLGNSWDFSTDSKLSFIVIGDAEDNPVPLNDGGRWIGVGSGDSANVATGVKLFQFEAVDTSVTSSVRSGVNTFVVDISQTGDEEYGTLTDSAVEKLFVGNYVTSSNQDFGLGFIVQQKPITLTSGSTGLPCDYGVASRFTSSSMLKTVRSQGGASASQYFSSQDIQIGDGSADLVWDSSFQSIEYPAAYDVSSGKVAYNVAEASFLHKIKLASGNSLNMSNGTANMGDFHRWEIDSATVNEDIYTFTGLNVLNATVVLQNKSLIDYSGMAFIGCKELTTNGADLSGGCSISDCVDTYAITVTSEAEFNALHNCNFSGNNYSIRITGNHGGDTWSATGMSVAGGTGTYDIQYTGTGTLTVEVEVGSGFSQLRSEATVGTLTISAPTVSLEVTSNVAASDIKIFETGTQTVEASGTGTSVTTTTAGTYDITVMKAGYLPQRQTGVVLGASSVTVAITLVEDPVYNASHGLTWAATTSPTAGQVHWARGTRRGYLADNQQGRDVYSALIDFWIAQSALDNTEFPIVAVGPDRFEFTSDGTTAAQLDSGSVTYWKGAGMTWEHATTGNDTHRYCSVKSVGTIGGTTKVRYVQEEGGTINSVTLVGGVVDQVIQYYSDTDGNGTADYNYDSHLVFKTFSTDYYQARANILSSFGISALEPYEYIFVLENAATGTVSGDQSFTPVVTNQQGAPVEEQTGYTFSFKVTEASNSKSPEAFLAQWLFDTYTDPTAANLYGSSLRAFDLPCPVVESGGSYSSVFQFVENTEDTTEKHGFYFEESAAYHPDFLQQQEDQDSGSGFFTTPIVAQISITNLPDDVGGDTRLYIYNNTTSTLIYSGDPLGTGYTNSYTNGDVAYATNGNSILIRFAHINGGTSSEYGQTTVLATTDGISADGDNFITADSVYATNAIDGSGVTKFSYSSVDDQFNLTVNSNFTAAELYAFYCYTLTRSDGISGAYGAFIASDAGNYKNVTAVADIFIDNETTASKRQTDTARIYKDDGSYPVLDPTTSGFGIDINWQNVVYVVTAGSGLTAGQAAELTAAAGASTFDPATDVVEGTETWTEAMRLVRANAAGKLAVSGTTVTMRDAADTKDRITATVDDDGQRTAVTTDGS